MTYTAYIDGGARGNPGPAAAGVKITDPSGHVVFAGGLFLGHHTNNEAEYAGLLFALDLLDVVGAEHICIRSDSELLVRQMQGRYKVKAENLKVLHEQGSRRLVSFKQYRFEHVRRELNKEADGLVNQALDALADVIAVDARNIISQVRQPSVAATPAKRGTSFHDAPHGQSSGSKRSKTAPSRHDEPFDRGESAHPLAGGPPGRGRPGSPDATVIVTVRKPPRAGGCPAGIRAGQVFQFADTVPAGLCVHACGAVIEAVLALQSVVSESAGSIEPITATCPQPECGAVFQVNVNLRA